MSPDEIEVMTAKWSEGSSGFELTSGGEQLVYLYNEDAISQIIRFAIRYSKTTNQLVNCHPAQVPGLLNSLQDELEDSEWSLKLGSINLKLENSIIHFEAIWEGAVEKTIRFKLDLSKEGI